MGGVDRVRSLSEPSSVNRATCFISLNLVPFVSIDGRRVVHTFIEFGNSGGLGSVLRGMGSSGFVSAF